MLALTTPTASNMVEVGAQAVLVAPVVLESETMALSRFSPIRRVRGITQEQEHDIRVYLQGLVYCWAKNRAGRWFAARDLVGGANFDWTGTPLFALYARHRAAGKDSEDAIKAAGKDVGWLIKSVLHQDRRTFEPSNGRRARIYRWDGVGP